MLFRSDDVDSPDGFAVAADLGGDGARRGHCVCSDEAGVELVDGHEPGERDDQAGRCCGELDGAGLEARRALPQIGQRMCQAWEDIPAVTICAIEGHFEAGMHGELIVV